jgi:hypothetical protein
MAGYSSDRESSIRNELSRTDLSSRERTILQNELNKVLSSPGYQQTKSAIDTAMQDYVKGGQSSGMLTGGQTLAEKAGSAVGLNRGQLLYGQNMMQTGEDIRGIKSDLKSRVEGSDPITEAIKQQAGQSRASTARQFAGRGVAGGVAAGAVEQAGRQKDIDIAASLYGQNRQNLKDYGNLVGNIAGQQGALEMSYMGIGTAGSAPTPTPPAQGGGLMGTVICTELHRQGYFSDETLEKEKLYGRYLIENEPDVYIGYRLWADHVVRGMRKSKVFSAIVATIATPWASYVSGNSNLAGLLINSIGVPFCKLVYFVYGRKLCIQ